MRGSAVRLTLALSLAFSPVCLRAEGEPPAPALSPGRVALLVRRAGEDSVKAQLHEALHDAQPRTRAAAARVLHASGQPGACAPLKNAVAGERTPEVARELVRGIASLCPDGAEWLAANRDALDPRVLASVFRKAVPGNAEEETEPAPGATPPVRFSARSGPAVMRTVSGYPPGFVPDLLSAAGCRPRGTSLAVAEVLFTPTGRPRNIALRLMPPQRECHEAAVALFSTGLLPEGYVLPADSPDHLVIVFDERALSGLDEDPVGAAVTPSKKDLVSPPKELERTRPLYPEGLRKERRGGRVLLEGRITTDGFVRELRVLKSAGGYEWLPKSGTTLDLEAIRAVSLWRYEPARVDNHPVPSWLTVTVTYSIR